MEYRNLGRAGVKVSPLWLGTAYFNTRISAEAAARLIHAALDAGINVIDTANAYSEPRGYAETIVGRAIKDRRDQVVLATKVFHPMGDGPNDRGSSRYHIMEQVHASLRRLNTDRIDLYQLHRPDPERPGARGNRGPDRLGAHRGAEPALAGQVEDESGRDIRRFPGADKEADEETGIPPRSEAFPMRRAGPERRA